MDETAHTPVRFCVGDVFHPRPVQILTELFQHLDLVGEVITTTTDGDNRAFLVVRVAGLDELILVPREKARPADAAEGEVTAAAGRL